MKELQKVYSPKDFEHRIYQDWMEKEYFKATVDNQKTPYTIVIPPPNITGQLHMGHALDNTIQDILIRTKRMQGFSALWVPGTDHASIATEAKIVEAMKAEGVTKDDLGRDGFLTRAWAWKEQYGGRIIEQLKQLGSSCDWSRERFTLDDGCSKAVQKVFINLYEKGLIYRGERIVNWCPHCLTSISDAEVEHEDQAGFFWHLRYPLTDGTGYLELATTRPETLLGDTAVAVNPNDPRYADFVGKTVTLPLVGREIPVVADDYVDMDFGTGVVKITPAHDPNDFEVGLRHDLPIINVMTDDAHIIDEYTDYAGMERYVARKAIVADLDAQGFLVKVEDHPHNVGTCYRCGTTIEPRVSKQWFVKMEPMAKPAIDAVKNGDTNFVPARFDKVYFHWLENIRDWCISRQLWWGHRIPAYYCDACGEVVVNKDKPACCPHCGHAALTQDNDTLDTWFSSALWPFSTLGWPDQTDDLNYFYPTSTLVTGYDIIPFWVMRMMFSGLEQTGEVPFDTVLIHGLVRDEQGRKMSKSLGNGIDPLEIIDEFGADALRFMLASGNSAGNDMRYSNEKVKAARNFANKLWNASRFILMNLSDEVTDLSLPDSFQIEDKWILSRYNRLITAVTSHIDSFDLGVAASKIYDFIWDDLCDWYIELTKSRIAEGGQTAVNAQKILVHVMAGALKLLHPFMPFITEEIWQALPNDSQSIMIAAWPVASDALDFAQTEADFEQVMAAIKGIRNARAEKNIPPSKKAPLFIETAKVELFEQGKAFFIRLASASEVTLGASFDLDDAMAVATDSARLLIPMGDLIDKEKELTRLNKEKEGCEKEIAMFEGKLSNEQFVSRAPEKVVEAERAKLARVKEKLTIILDSIAKL